MGFSQEFLVFCACVCTLILLFIIRKSSTQKGEPYLLRSPPALPIIGHLHLLKQPLHQTLHQLAQKYGPFFLMKLGTSPVLIISSADWAKEIFQTHDRDFGDRPKLEASKRLFYNNKSMIMMDQGPLWRNLRKLYTVHILTAKRIEMFEKARFKEMAMTMELIMRHALEGGRAGINMRQLVFNTVGNMMTSMLFSKRSFDTSESIDGRKSRFKDMMEEFSVLFGTPLLGDVIPWLGWLDMGSKKKMDKLAKEVDAFLEGVLVERIEGIKEDNQGADYLDILISVYKEDDGKLDKDSIKCNLLDLLIASTESITTTIEWAIAELMASPISMKKLQEELDTLVGEDALMGNTSKCIKDDDLATLNYLQAVIKETLRLHPPFAVISHQMTKGLDKGKKIKDYYLPKEMKVICNVWAMGRDTTVWGPNADTFFPDRFLSGFAPNLHGQHFEFLPFGTGRRGCPGMNFALIVAPLLVANLVQVFNWKAPNDSPLDLSEAIAFTTPLARPLVALPTLRK